MTDTPSRDVLNTWLGFLRKIPGSLMIVPLFLGALVNTFCNYSAQAA